MLPWIYQVDPAKMLVESAGVNEAKDARHIRN